MGSGEFGGGGSVIWRVRYNGPKGDNPGGSGKPLHAHGKDNDPAASIGSKLYVTCKNGRGRVAKDKDDEVIVEVTLAAEGDVVLTWGDDALNGPKGA